MRVRSCKLLLLIKKCNTLRGAFGKGAYKNMPKNLFGTGFEKIFPKILHSQEEKLSQNHFHLPKSNIPMGKGMLSLGKKIKIPLLTSTAVCHH